MIQRKIQAVVLSIIMLIPMLAPEVTVSAQDDKAQRNVYLHAQGENPTETTNVSTVYMGENTDLYFAVDNPNKGLCDENGEHMEPQYDMNGYTVKIYFDPYYLDFASEGGARIDYTVPNKGFNESEVGGNGDNTEIGYTVYRQGTDSNLINGITYKSAYVTVFFSGVYLPNKSDGQLWYNLCKLPLVPQRTGSTEVFIETSGSDKYTLELFAKNQSSDPSEQTFGYSAVNGGYHQIVIKDKLKPAPPTVNPPAGSYNEKQTVELSVEDGCTAYYSIDGGVTFTEYSLPIEVETTTDIFCKSKRTSDGKESDAVSYQYRILPKAPYLFVNSGGDKKLIPNIYEENNTFEVYVADKNVFGNIDDVNEVYYTFSDTASEEMTIGTNPEVEWVKVNKISQSIEIDRKRTVRLITVGPEEKSDVSWYYLGVKPAAVTANHDSGEYTNKIDVMLSCETVGAEIYYTTDGKNPITDGIEYNDPIPLAKDATLRAVALYDGVYSDVSAYHYIFTFYDDYGVDAFYPSGVYEGSVNVTLTPNNPENKIVYSTDGGVSWSDYTEVLNIDKDTDIIAKSVDKDNNEGEGYKFTYKIKPMPPRFAPESTQFTNADEITVYCEESTNENTGRYTLYYTMDGSDPITSDTRMMAPADSDMVTVNISRYTVVSAVVKKDDTTYSTVVKHSYDIVTKKPVKPITTLTPGNYARTAENETGYSTMFMPVPTGTEIYYTLSRGGSFAEDPIPNTEGTIKYDGTPIEITGRTIIKAVAVNVFGVKSDVGIFDYTVTPEAPKAAPSAVIGGDQLPVVPVTAVKSSVVKYEINGFSNEFKCKEEDFFIDTSTGSAYEDKECTKPLGTVNTEALSSPAVLNIWAELDGIESSTNRYTYRLSDNADTLAPPYANKETGDYEEIKADDENYLLYVSFNSLNSGDTIQYKLSDGTDWIEYDGSPVKLKSDTIIQLRAVKGDVRSSVASYVYNFYPLAPVITLSSGRYIDTPVPTTKLEYDSRIPTDKSYDIFYRRNGDSRDFRYGGSEIGIEHTMSVKAYVVNNDTDRVSKNTINYYIIESKNAAIGSVYIANPYDVSRISAAVLDTGEYANGIKLLTQSRDAEIHYFYSYKTTDGVEYTTNNMIYDIANPIRVNSSMENITITAWLENESGRIEDSDFTHTIDFIHLNIPVTSLGSDKVEFKKGTVYTLINDYPEDVNMLLYYTTDGSDPTDPDNSARKLYNGEELKLSEAVTVKAVYFSACGKCVECKNDNPSDCWYGVYGRTGVYKYTVTRTSGSSGGGGGGSGFGSAGTVVDNTRKYTKDIFGAEHPTHIGYINGYPDGSVKPEGKITREEIAAILYRVKNHEYEKPNVFTAMFPDVPEQRWSALNIEYMANSGVILGYPEGDFKPEKNLTRAEFAALICRFIEIDKAQSENPFDDLSEDHWAYEDIMSLYSGGLINGYEDKTFRPQSEISRAEIMTVVNKILGRNPSEEYVKTLEYNPFNDLDKGKWYYVDVLEATITHNYYLDENGVEIKWDDCK